MQNSKNRKSSSYIWAGVILLAIIIAIVGIAMKKNGSERVVPTYTDEDGQVYVAALLKEISDDKVTVDVIEYITDDDTERMKELDLTEEDMPDGYYLYNPDEKTTEWTLDERTVYTFIDWNGDFTGAEYPEAYTTTDAGEFAEYIGTYDNSAPQMPFFFQVEENRVTLILEKPFA